MTWCFRRKKNTAVLSKRTKLPNTSQEYRTLHSDLKRLLTNRSTSSDSLKQHNSYRCRTHFTLLNTIWPRFFPEINKENLMTIWLTDIEIIRRPIGDDPLWTLMSSPVLQKSFDCFLYVTTHLYHISSSLTLNHVWVSNDCECKLFIKTETGDLDECECITDFIKDSSFGIHT